MTTHLPTAPTRRRGPSTPAELTRVEREPGSRRWWSDTLVFAGRNVEHIRQIPEKLLDVTLQPLMFVLLFAYVFGGAIAVQGGNYREYIIGGILIQSLAFGLDGPGDRRSRPTSPKASSTGSARCPATRTAYLLGPLPRRARAAWRCRSSSCSAPGSIVGWRVHSDVLDVGDRVRAAAHVRLGDDLDRHVDRAAGALARRGHGRRASRRVPAHVPQQRVRPDRDAADGAAVVRGVEPGQRRWSRRPASCSATRRRRGHQARLAARPPGARPRSSTAA